MDWASLGLASLFLVLGLSALLLPSLDESSLALASLAWASLGWVSAFPALALTSSALAYRSASRSTTIGHLSQGGREWQHLRLTVTVSFLPTFLLVALRRLNARHLR